MEVKELEQVVVRFSGDSGDGMQLAGNIFSTVSATVGNGISTFPDYPADIRAPQGSLTGVSGFQVHIGAGKVYTPGDRCDVLVAMNAAALKTQYRYAKPQATIIIDTDSFGPNDLKKAQFDSDDYLLEMGIDPDRVVACPITKMVKDCLADSGMDNKSILKCRNMFALGLVCWLFNRDLSLVENFLREKFARKPQLAEANIKVVNAGYNYGENTHSSTPATYRIETKEKVAGRYMDITGNKATAYGLIAAAEKAGLKLYLGSYPITPATDILHELAKHKSCGVITVQCEDEISGCASAVGAAFAGALGVTSTSGPGLCLKSEAINLAVIDELGLQFVEGIRRPDRDNAIDVYLSDEYEDVLADGVWQGVFRVKPEPITAKEKKDWIASQSGVTCGSDAFFPFGDNVERAHKSGVQYIAEPGGSIRDDHVIATANKYNMVMAFTGMRLFHH